MKKAIVSLILVMALALYTGALAESVSGTFVPDRFTYSGGTGKVTISCSSISLENGSAQAEIVFSSPNYTVAKLDGNEYEARHEGSNSIFDVPVPLNQTFSFIGTTTAMSQPHDVTYTLYIGLDAAGGKELAGLTYSHSMERQYAECFAIDFYEGGYIYVSMDDETRYLIIPEGQNAPDGLDPEIVILQKPLNRIYLAATSAMSLLDRLDALSMIRFSGTEADGWTVTDAAEAMQKGDILFAGKYSEPDYELLVKEDCNLAVESTMIYHSPKVQELLQLLGIPVLIDRSSYEPHPLGRTEWIRLYGVLSDREEAAETFFAEQVSTLQTFEQKPLSGKTVAFFYIAADGQAVVRGTSDYIAQMIELGGGAYAFGGLSQEGDTRASVSVTMEDFYSSAVNADYLIYNTSIDTSVDSMDSLLAKSPLLQEFKAVRDGNCFAAGRSLYQAADNTVQFIEDIFNMLSGQWDNLVFLSQLR